VKNSYEFNIEDINNVKFISHGKFTYTINYKRICDENNNPTLYFKEEHQAEIETTDNDHIGKVCSHCGSWNYFHRSLYEDENFVYSCEHCDGSDIIQPEEEVVDMISSFMNESDFQDIDIYINDIHII